MVWRKTIRIIKGLREVNQSKTDFRIEVLIHRKRYGLC